MQLKLPVNLLITLLSDDILLTDADFFPKLRCFNSAFGDQYLLMPNRIEPWNTRANCAALY